MKKKNTSHTEPVCGHNDFTRCMFVIYCVPDYDVTVPYLLTSGKMESRRKMKG